MHQAMVNSRQKAVVDEKVFLQRQPRVAALEVAGAVAGDPVAQRQVLGAGRGADRIGLYEAELADRASESGGFEQRSRNGIPAQVIERDRHRSIIPQSIRGSRGATSRPTGTPRRAAPPCL